MTPDMTTTPDHDPGARDPGHFTASDSATVDRYRVAAYWLATGALETAATPPTVADGSPVDPADFAAYAANMANRYVRGVSNTLDAVPDLYRAWKSTVWITATLDG